MAEVKGIRLSDGSVAYFPAGKDGVSPTVSLTKANGIATIKVTDKDGTKTVNINDGKSAYEYAKDGGYTGTEQEFIQKLVGETQGGSTARIGEVTLSASNWNGSGNLFSQVVTIDGVTENTQVDLTPSVEQLAVFYEKDLALVTENEDGVVTVYAIGQKPQNDYTIQVTMTEVAYE